MDEIGKKTAPRLPGLSRPKRGPAAENAAALAILAAGGYGALRLMGLLFRVIGVG